MLNIIIILIKLIYETLLFFLIKLESVPECNHSHLGRGQFPLQLELEID